MALNTRCGVGLIKSTLKPLLRPLRTAGGRFFIRPTDESSIVWKAAQILSGELVEGDYLEFGVFRGGSFAHAFNAVKSVYNQRSQEDIHPQDYKSQVTRIWDEMRFFAFDSFCGLPKPCFSDAESKDFVESKFSCDLNTFRANLKSASVDLTKVIAVPGWFEETCVSQTIEKYNMKAASIIYIDCDLYESARVVLKFIEPLLTDGSVIIFDDWYCFRGNPELGEQRAFNEWKNKLLDWTFCEYQKEGGYRNSFIASRKASFA